MLLAWLLLFGASPGVLWPGGSALLAVAGVAVWGATVARPLAPATRERRRFFGGRFAEWLANGIGGAALVAWIWYVVPFGLLYIGAGWGLYFLLGGALARALTRGGFPLGVAAALGFVGCETLRSVFDPPIGLGWLRLGHYLHDDLWLSGGARVFGVEGLSLVVALCGGALSELLVRAPLVRAPMRQARERVRSGWSAGGRWSFAAAAAALALAALASALTGPPATRPGPRVLLVQPGFPQRVKQHDPPFQNYRRVRALTLAALEEGAARAEEPPDLVAWSETMLQIDLVAPEVGPALAAGVRPPPWRSQLSLAEVAALARLEDEWVRRGILVALPEGTSFVTGAEVLEVVGQELRRRNAIVLYDPGGRRSAAASKRYLVSGAETMHGLERFDSVRALVQRIAGYVPDFAPAGETRVLGFETRDGERYHFGATVCFDNAFLPPYTEPVTAGPLDFHFVASNEAWYRGSFELDQMVAFSRIIALATGRAVVRATNSGVSTVLGPDGRELRRVRSRGRDRSVAGTLVVDVPVPEDPSEVPFYAASRAFWPALVLGAVGAAWLRLALGRRRREDPG